MNAVALLPTAPLLERALGPNVDVVVSAASSPRQMVGEVLRAAAQDSAYRHFRGRSSDELGDTAFGITVLALVFDSDEKASRTFSAVAEAAHLRTRVGSADVAVETADGTNGLVSYWGFVRREQAIVVVTLDTLHPLRTSIADLRAMVLAVAERMEEMAGRT
jgi:predicted DNA-binding transcriptional regulator YafY